MEATERLVHGLVVGGAAGVQAGWPTTSSAGRALTLEEAAEAALADPGQ